MNPLDVDRLRAVKTILVHGGGCPDGIASAILLHDVLPHAKVRFIQYNSDEHFALKPEPNMLLADFTPKIPEIEVDGKKVYDPAKLKVWAESGAFILDHHKGAGPIVAACGENGRFGDEETEPGVCGAVLCYRHVWLPLGGARSMVEAQFAENFATLAGIRDTWQRKDPRWTDACAQAETLRFYPEDNWLAIERPFTVEHERMWWERRQLVGNILVAKHARAVKAVLEKAWRFTSAKGTRVVMFDGTSMSSDASDVAENADLVIGFGYYVESGVQKMTFSTRTRAGYNCLALCKSFGGGGHSSAAGFTVNVTDTKLNPYQLAEVLVNEHEGKQ